ncbi:MAG: DCC1-like thiol-disulfide oxidoreductase family protein, partial [Alphaproteobacteria bacterium]|nr:DCC1-like thiol-disulfide oxidoreductase family protein [Alphaproteobacteria bacterium]
MWFDGSCPLCEREIALMRRLDRSGRVTFVDLSPSDSPLETHCPSDRSAMLRRLHA